MADDIHYYEPSTGHGLAHDPFNSIVGPRPIGWISTVDRDGKRNLAPYSFFNAFNYVPPIVGFCSIGYKDSVRNVEATGEFGWSLSTLPLAEAMNTSCAAVGPEVDEFTLAGLTPAPSRHIGAPRVGESPVSFECKLTQMMRLKTAAGREVDSWMMFGEVVAVYIDRSVLKDGVYQTTAAQPILRGGGPGDYFKVTEAEKFVMLRPRG
ncbi:MAG: flavin reductase family protein [Janthinobacterium lividum]